MNRWFRSKREWVRWNLVAVSMLLLLVSIWFSAQLLSKNAWFSARLLSTSLDSNAVVLILFDALLLAWIWWLLTWTEAPTAPASRALSAHVWRWVGLAVICACAIMAVSVLVYLDRADVWLKDHPGKTPLDGLGSFIAGVSAFIATLFAFGTAYSVTWRAQQGENYKAAVQAFRLLYDEFWKREDIAEVRRWIVSSKEYSTTLRPVLIARRPYDRPNRLDEQQNRVLDKLDNFLSVLARMELFKVVGVINFVDEKGQDLLRKALGGTARRPNDVFWLRYIHAGRRDELWDYVKCHWSELIPEGFEESLSSQQDLTAPNPSAVGELEIWVGVDVSR